MAQRLNYYAFSTINYNCKKLRTCSGPSTFAAGGLFLLGQLPDDGQDDNDDDNPEKCSHFPSSIRVDGFMGI
jgi:hypothetical protein